MPNKLFVFFKQFEHVRFFHVRAAPLPLMDPAPDPAFLWPAPRGPSRLCGTYCAPQGAQQKGADLPPGKSAPRRPSLNQTGVLSLLFLIQTEFLNYKDGKESLYRDTMIGL